MTDLWDVLLPDILPDIFSDAAKTEAFALAERAVRRKICDQADKIMFYFSLSVLDDPILDRMAVEMKAPYYSDQLAHDVKVELIRNTIRWHMMAGTRAAVEELTSAVFHTDRVQEWFEYNGEPFRFRISTELDFSPENLSMFRELVGKVKNTAMTLDDILLRKDLAMRLKVRGNAEIEEEVTVLCGKKERDVQVS